MIQVLKPFSTDLCLLSDLKAELKITSVDAARDALLSKLITRASKTISEAIGRPLVRQYYREGVKSYGTGRLLLTVTPLAGLADLEWMTDPSLDFGSTTLAAIEKVFVVNPNAGILETIQGYRSSARGFPGIEPEYMTGTEVGLIRADYWGGWFPPGSFYTRDSIFFVESDQSIHSGSAFPIALQVDDLIEISGSEDNSGLFRIASIPSSTKMILDGASVIVDESASMGQNVTLSYRSLPGEIEDVALMLSKILWLSRDRDASIRYQRTDDLEVWYLREADVGTRFPPQIREVLNSYKRATTP